MWEPENILVVSSFWHNHYDDWYWQEGKEDEDCWHGSKDDEDEDEDEEEEDEDEL